MAYTPPKRRTYKGSITNTDRWQEFRNRPGDVFICTPPKCGTTWTIDAQPALIDAVEDASSFGIMKSQADRFAPFADAGYWRDPKAFFDFAGSRKWSGKVSDAAISQYSARVAQLLEPTNVAWLEGGECEFALV